MTCRLTVAVLLFFCVGACSSEDPEERDGSVGEKDAAQSSPYIKIISPKAGDEWKVGATQKITWETDLEDVTISYSTEGGENWKRISDTVDTMSPDWPSFAWVVPDEPSDQVIVEVKGYDGDVPTKSGVFKIVK